jgi:hypothetical protein
VSWLALKGISMEYPAEPLSSDAKREPQISVAKQVGTFAGLLVGFVLVLVLYIVLADEPFGIQVATIVAYTGFVFFSVFCDSRWLKGYSLRQKAVRKEIPLLLAIHAVFLVVVFMVLTIALSLRPSLPASWLAERGKKHDSWFVDLLLLIGAVTITFQVFISRRILSRSVKAQSN